MANGSRGGTPQQVVAAANSSDLRASLYRCEFPLIVWSMPEGEIWLANEAAAEVVNLPLSQLIGRSVFDFVSPRVAVERSGALLTSGTADGLRAERRLHRHGLDSIPICIWSRAIELDGRREVIALLVPRDQIGGLGRDPSTPWRDLVHSAVGLLDDRWRIVQISADISDMLGRPPAACIGSSLLDLFEPEEVPAELRDAPRRPLAVYSLHQLRADRPDGSRVEVSLLIAPLRSRLNEAAFAIVGDCDGTDSGVDRVTELEMRLRRIGAEVRAAGMLETVEGSAAAMDHPQVKELTSRQWEIVGMLVHGQRVPTIAKTLFVSQSTVRNHLSAIFRKFGVHSQAELLEVLGPPATGAPPPASRS